SPQVSRRCRPLLPRACRVRSVLPPAAARPVVGPPRNPGVAPRPPPSRPGRRRAGERDAGRHPDGDQGPASGRPLTAAQRPPAPGTPSPVPLPAQDEPDNDKTRDRSQLGQRKAPPRPGQRAEGTEGTMEDDTAALQPQQAGDESPDFIGTASLLRERGLGLVWL